jgi:hypothetical protein
MDKGKYQEKKEPTDTMMISVAQLVKKNVRSTLDVRSRRTKQRPLLRLVHPRGRWAG